METNHQHLINNIYNLLAADFLVIYQVKPRINGWSKIFHAAENRRRKSIN